ncbi:LacI family DNA-binding transcriptional regulator [Lederbergia lenta]|uniref:Transcriptional regulator n=1 Tax=Lederbergia lenta TaxID=1467 RepID=A0A2X4ZS49_LEDLE|nr:LacI family DNA-binding transcriptional regulator [Lederbergia lenta]MEC2323295.1 LacI family DNA-binding transcriptional regulator [Lederbergia lenta]SQI63154.1 transcriptional regulator [Lederbergia lenta]
MGKEIIINHKVTIKDVAKEAGVSISTVSNALNGVDVLHPDTKEHILNVAKRMNYIPNINGRNLKSNRTKVLGLFITTMTGPYYGTLTDAIYKQCEKNGYELNIFITKNDQNALSNILGRRVDGAIISNEFISETHEDLLGKANIPIVFLDREKTGKVMSSVVFNSYKGGQVVAEYLIQLGHEKLGYIKGFGHIYDDIERFRGFQDTLKDAGLAFSTDHLLYGDFEEEASYDAVKAFINSGKDLPDAFFAGNDSSAIGCMKALQSEGLSIPEDISVIGFDDIEISEYYNPPITTVNNPISEQGILAVDRLINLIQNNGVGQLDRLEGNLVVRNSCTAKKNETSL